MNNFKIKTSAILTTFALLAHYAPAMEANIAETGLKRKQQEELERRQDEFKKKIKLISQTDQNVDISEVTLIANEFGLNANQRRDLEGRLNSCLSCNMSGATLTSRLRQRAKHLKKLEGQGNIKVIYNDITINLNNEMKSSFPKKCEVDFNHIHKLNKSNVIVIDIPEIKSNEIISNKNVYEKIDVKYNFEKELILMVLDLAEGRIKKSDIYKDGINVDDFLKVNSEKITSLNINGDDYIKTEYQYDDQNFLFDIENNVKINRINDSFMVNYLSIFKNIFSIKLTNIPEITDHSLYFLKYLKNIKHVEIIKCIQLSDMFVRNILSKTKLDFFSIQDCMRIKPNWKGTFSKYELFKLYRENEKALENGKLLEEVSADLKKEISKNTIESMKENTFFKIENTTLNFNEYKNMCFYPTEIILREYIPTDESINGLKRRDVANNILMNLVNTFPNTQRLDLSKTAVTEACLWHLEKLVNLEYLDTRNTNMNSDFKGVYESRITSHDLIAKFISLNINFVKNSLVDSFFLNS